MEVSKVLDILDAHVCACEQGTKTTNKKPLTSSPLPLHADTCSTHEQLFPCAVSNLVFSATSNLKVLKISASKPSLGSLHVQLPGATRSIASSSPYKAHDCAHRAEAGEERFSPVTLKPGCWQGPTFAMALSSTPASRSLLKIRAGGR